MDCRWIHHRFPKLSPWNRYNSWRADKASRSTIFALENHRSISFWQEEKGLSPSSSSNSKSSDGSILAVSGYSRNKTIDPNARWNHTYLHHVIVGGKKNGVCASLVHRTYHTYVIEVCTYDVYDTETFFHMMNDSFDFKRPCIPSPSCWQAPSGIKYCSIYEPGGNRSLSYDKEEQHRAFWGSIQYGEYVLDNQT